MSRFVSRKFAPSLLGLLSFAVILAVWEAVVRAGWVNAFFTSQPTAIARALGQQLRSGALLHNLAVSLREFAAGFGAATVVGLVLGILAGRYRTFEYLLDPFLWFTYSAPLIAFYPLFVIWLGLGSRTVIAITFLLAVTPITVNSLTGIKNVNPGILRAARSFGARQHDLVWKVIFPASVPMVVAGLRLGIGRALMGVVISELFGATAGLGFSIAYYAGLLQTANMLASLVVIVALGVLCTQALSALEARLDSWRTGPGL